LGLQFKAGGKQEAWAGAWSVITRNESAYIARWVKEVDTICTYNLEQSTIVLVELYEDHCIEGVST